MGGQLEDEVESDFFPAASATLFEEVPLGASWRVVSPQSADTFFLCFDLLLVFFRLDVAGGAPAGVFVVLCAEASVPAAPAGL